jgi:hypothetical protein
MRLRCIVYVAATPDQWPIREPYCLNLAGGYAPLVYPARDFGEGWAAASSMGFAYTQSLGVLYGQTVGSPAPDGGSFVVRYYLPAGATPPQAACYLVDGDQLVADTPSGAYSVRDLIEHEGDVWAAGWAYADTCSVVAGETSHFNPSESETEPSTSPSDPLVPTVGDAGFRLYDYATEEWERVADTQYVARLRPAVWKRDGVTGAWTEYVGPAWEGSRAVEFYSDVRPFRLASTPYGVCVIAEAFVADQHPVQNGPGGTPLHAAHPTYLIDAGGYVSFAGYAAAIADTGGGVIIIGPSAHWYGPAVRHVIGTNAVPIDPDLRRWGGRVPEVLRDWVKAKYA